MRYLCNTRVCSQPSINQNGTGQDGTAAAHRSDISQQARKRGHEPPRSQLHTPPKKKRRVLNNQFVVLPHHQQYQQRGWPLTFVHCTTPTVTAAAARAAALSPCAGVIPRNCAQAEFPRNRTKQLYTNRTKKKFRGAKKSLAGEDRLRAQSKPGESLATDHAGLEISVHTCARRFLIGQN